ncbi:YlcI/YnfO family protein [Limnobaculum parvum]|uniref:Prevent-host-death protein n=1 Tax=Limnobaculum parvum TaxID=2172103 RepID=A0A2Y9TWW8_9GAMM|nr:YlcI/YnfO family protein [Limnobaculum parvum]AWH87999.1 prevent-host-death protein [Limnobaculum parvum]
MKTASFPSLRVSPELRSAAERALYDGESISGFIEKAIIKQIEQRQMNNEFIQNAMNSRDKSRETGEYRSATDVLSALSTKLNEAKVKQK